MGYIWKALKTNDPQNRRIFEMKKRPTKVEYLDRNSKPSELWFGSLCTDEEIQERLQDMKDVGFKVIKHYKVDRI